MRIMHCCLAAFYIDNYGYQENILPKMHKLQGHDVEILASTETYIENNCLGYIEAGSYINENGIPVTRLPYVNFLYHKVAKKLRLYDGVYSKIEAFKPDVIFLHDVQFLSVIDIVKYVKCNNVRIYVDGHTDFINSARNWISKNILHKIIYKWCAKKIEPYASKFWGVTPLREDFFVDVYGIDRNKVDLLVLGVDDDLIDFSNKEKIIKEKREALNISQNDLVLITGGKIDKRKNIHILMKVFSELKQDNLKLVIFGEPVEELKKEFNTLVKNENIIHLGWLKADVINDYLFMSDLAVFPGTHSVIWEQCVGLGIPCIFKRWKGMTHIDVGGNCLFLETSSETEIKKLLLNVMESDKLLTNMKKIAENQGIKEFSYDKIAKKAIEEL